MRVAIVGAGPAGLMAADVLSQRGLAVDVYDAMPSVGRKFLMAGKGGLNITHSEPFAAFVARYDAPDWLAPMLHRFGADSVRQWMANLGVNSFVGTSGRVFPVEMKAAPLLRSWVSALKKRGVKIHTRHVWQGFAEHGALNFTAGGESLNIAADAVVLATGGGSWAKLGSDGRWFEFLRQQNVPLAPLRASNGGFVVVWSGFMRALAGLPLKNIVGWVQNEQGDVLAHSQSECVLTDDGVEGGLLYALSRPLREQLVRDGAAALWLDLLPHVALADLTAKLQPSTKQSLANVWRKAGLDAVRIALIREVLPKNDWSNAPRVAQCLKKYRLNITAQRPIDEAISTAGGVMQSALNEHLMLHALKGVFCCGEMLDWDAPTGGYLLTACFASGQHAARGVLDYLGLNDGAA